MDKISPPYVDSDGSQVFPVTNIRRNMNVSENRSHGEVRWSRRDGITIRFEFDVGWDEALAGVGRSNSELCGGAGSVEPMKAEPEWVAETGDGCELMVFGTFPKTVTTTNQTNSSRSAKRTVTGPATYVEVQMSRENPLSFWYNTPPCARLFFPDFSIYPWPQTQSITGQGHDLEYERPISMLQLLENPSLTLFQADSRFLDVKGGWVNGTEGVWLTFHPKEPNRFGYDAECDTARVLISLLLGRATPCLWRDFFLDGERLSRLYYGWHKSSSPLQGNEPPVPVGPIPPRLSHGHEVVARIPRLLARLSAVRSQYNLDFIMMPLWTATDANFVIDDKLALACVSLERISTAHDEVRKTQTTTSGRGPLLSPRQLKGVCDAIKPILRRIADSEQIEDDVLQILEKKIDNFHQTPNADKLSQVFIELGVE